MGIFVSYKLEHKFTFTYFEGTVMATSIPTTDLLENPYRYPHFRRHWTPDGHRYVSRKIYDYMIQHDYINSDQGETEPKGLSYD
ncbi:uncharacterized protein METZ01_LOCUS186746, partial [marine metagenome]